MSKQENQVTPVVTKSTRVKNPGVVNRHEGIPVGEGCDLQDVPRAIIMQHMRKSEEFAKNKFNEKYGASHRASQSF